MNLQTSGPNKAQRLQLRRPLRRHPLARLAAVQLLLERPLVLDPVAEPRVLGPALRHVAVAVLPLVGLELGQLRLPAHVVGRVSVLVLSIK